jgi:hypothetical protein
MGGSPGQKTLLENDSSDRGDIINNVKVSAAFRPFSTGNSPLKMARNGATTWAGPGAADVPERDRKIRRKGAQLGRRGARRVLTGLGRAVSR